jgi:hypothetical protein
LGSDIGDPFCSLGMRRDLGGRFAEAAF